MKPKKGVFTYTTIEGEHTLRVEQEKLYKSTSPILLTSLCILDASLIDKTPLYASYESKFYLDKSININVTLNKSIKEVKKFINIVDYHLDVAINEEVHNTVLNNHFIATTKERKLWLKLSCISILIPTILLTVFFVILIWHMINNQNLFCAGLFAFLEIALIFVSIIITSNYYCNYTNRIK